MESILEFSISISLQTPKILPFTITFSKVTFLAEIIKIFPSIYISLYSTFLLFSITTISSKILLLFELTVSFLFSFFFYFSYNAGIKIYSSIILLLLFILNTTLITIL